MDSYFGQKQQYKVRKPVFVSNMQLFASQDVN